MSTHPATTTLRKPTHSKSSAKTNAMNLRQATFCLTAALLALAPTVSTQAGDWGIATPFFPRPNLSVAYHGTATWSGQVYARFKIECRSASVLGSPATHVRVTAFSDQVSRTEVRSVPSLAPGATRWVWVHLGSSNSIYWGGFSTSARVDPYGQITESNERDNYARGSRPGAAK